jgi:YVTN family beta-propeller protein
MKQLIFGIVCLVGSAILSSSCKKDGTTCYISNQNDGTVSVANVSTLKEMMKITVGKKPNDIVIRYM